MYSKYIDEIKKEMKKEKMTITNLAEKIGVSRIALSQFLNGKNHSLKMLEKVYKYLFKCEYTELNVLSEFSSEELLRELLKREKNKSQKVYLLR